MHWERYYCRTSIYTICAENINEYEGEGSAISGVPPSHNDRRGAPQSDISSHTVRTVDTKTS